MEYKPKPLWASATGIAVIAVVLVLALVFLFVRKGAADPASGGAAVPITNASPDTSAQAGGNGANASSGRASLSVTLAAAQSSSWNSTLAANGSIAAWQESIIGTELNGVRLSELLVQIGDKVKRGQLLARFSDETIQAELAQQNAVLAEAEATLADAQSNARRALQLKESGAMSVQQINQYATARNTASARVSAAKAALQGGQLRLQQTRVLAPDDGVISSRTATVGAIAQGGQELFRMIRQGRLEWRAELTAEELNRVTPGQEANVTAADGSIVKGKVRMLAPTIDAQTRKAMVYVDLVDNAMNAKSIRAGMFAKGEFILGENTAVTVPANAVVLRDGYANVFTVDSSGKVRQMRVESGRSRDGRTEIISGLSANAKVVDSGAGFLADGDIVHVLDKVTLPQKTSVNGKQTLPITAAPSGAR